jgi:hypothetical protein
MFCDLQIKPSKSIKSNPKPFLFVRLLSKISAKKKLLQGLQPQILIGILTKFYTKKSADLNISGILYEIGIFTSISHCGYNQMNSK